MTAKIIDLSEAFEERVIRHEGDRCWEWRGAHMTSGYARIDRREGDRRVTILGHRLAYELFVGPIPEELVVDHLCRNRGCVNPDHLELVTNEENIARGEWLPIRLAARTHCNSGHEFTPENTYVPPGTRTRKCRECIRVQQRTAYRRKKEAS